MLLTDLCSFYVVLRCGFLVGIWWWVLDLLFVVGIFGGVSFAVVLVNSVGLFSFCLFLYVFTFVVCLDESVVLGDLVWLL